MLEYWNNGFWDNAIVGLMVKFVSTIKLRIDNIFLKTNLSVFHHSTIPYPMQAFKLQKNSIISLGCRISKR